jgi:O-succinylbenzoate synthase
VASTPSDRLSSLSGTTEPHLYDEPMLQHILESLHVVSIPMRTRFRGLKVREAALFSGPRGWTEFSPFIEYNSVEASQWLQAAISYAWQAPPALHRRSVPVNATVPSLPPAEVATVLARFDRCDTVKVKVAERGQRLLDDLARLREVRRLAPRAKIRVDANGGWSVTEAIEAVRAFARFDLEYVEQPCQSVAELAELRHQLRKAGDDTLIAADESVRKADDPLLVARSNAADVLIIKAQPLGGVARALRIVREAGLPVVVSSALDTSIGISLGVQLAAALPDDLLAGACGLGTVNLLAGDTCEPSLVPIDGMLKTQSPRVSRDRLLRFQAEPDRIAWWRERITRCFAVLSNETN